MSFYKIPHALARPFSAVIHAIQLAVGLPFTDVFSETDIQQAFDDAGCRFAEDEDAVFTPSLTFWAFLSQMLFTGAARSCNAAVLRYHFQQRRIDVCLKTVDRDFVVYWLKISWNRFHLEVSCLPFPVFLNPIRRRVVTRNRSSSKPPAWC